MKLVVIQVEVSRSRSLVGSQRPTDVNLGTRYLEALNAVG